MFSWTYSWMALNICNPSASAKHFAKQSHASHPYLEFEWCFHLHHPVRQAFGLQRHRTLLSQRQHRGPTGSTKIKSSYMSISRDVRACYMVSPPIKAL